MSTLTPMTGMLRAWNDDRGFGFIRPEGGGPDVFVHISDFVAAGGGGVRPAPGEKLLFDLAAGKDGKPRAVRVRRPGETLRVVNHTAAAPALSAGADAGARAGGRRHHSGDGRGGRRHHPPRRHPASLDSGSGSRGRVFRALGAMALVVAGIAVFSYGKPWWAGWSMPDVVGASSSSGGGSAQQVFDTAAARRQQQAPRFSCDGRTYCSQMTSCEEATFFLRNCPGVKMDGNNDGVPCEQQWCGQ